MERSEIERCCHPLALFYFFFIIYDFLLDDVAYKRWFYEILEQQSLSITWNTIFEIEAMIKTDSDSL